MTPNNMHKLVSLIMLAVESIYEEIHKIDMPKLERTLPENDFNDLFSHICNIDEMRKTILISTKEIIEGHTEDNSSIEIDDIFNKEKTVFRLFYMINDYLEGWRIERLKKEQYQQFWGNK